MIVLCSSIPKHNCITSTKLLLFLKTERMGFQSEKKLLCSCGADFMFMLPFDFFCDSVREKSAFAFMKGDEGLLTQLVCKCVCG